MRKPYRDKADTFDINDLVGVRKRREWRSTLVT